jgi:segregation and condensation protein B
MDLGENEEPCSGPELAALIEALLLVAAEPSTLEQLACGAGVTVPEVETALATLERDEGRGWVIQRHQGTAQLATAPRFAGQVRRFLGLERETRLSAPALETLAIVAYQQPVTRAEVEAVRGVDCAGVMATLHGRGLIEAIGRLETVGHPIQYGTTPVFLGHFGLRSLAELPALGEVEGRDAGLLLQSTVAAAGLDDGARHDQAGAVIGEDGYVDTRSPLADTTSDRTVPPGHGAANGADVDSQSEIARQPFMPDWATGPTHEETPPPN